MLTSSLESAWFRYRSTKLAAVRENTAPFRLAREAFFHGAAGLLLLVQDNVARLPEGATAADRGNAMLEVLADALEEIKGMTREKEPEPNPVLV